jgi:general stress protein 26
MATKTRDKNADNEVSTSKKLDDLYKLIDGMGVAMFTTRRPDGHLVSRPMETQERTAGTDLWFVTDIESNKLEELATDPHVNLGYYKDGTREWVSVSGTAIISRDRKLVRELYKPDWKAWFGDQGGERDGSAEDPRIALLLVEAHSVTYLKKDRPTPVVLFNIVKGMITGEPPKTGDLRELGERELKQAPQLELRGAAQK